MRGMLWTVVLFIIGIFLMAGCGSKEKKSEASQIKSVTLPPTAICCVDSVPVYLNTSASLINKYLHWGDVVKLEPDSQHDPAHAGSFYFHIVLDDGTNCFVAPSAVVPGGQLAAVTDSLKIYLHGDSTAATGTSFAPMEVVIAAPEGTAWTEIRSSKSGKKGWVRSGHLAYHQTDIQVAIAIVTALAEPDTQKRATSFQEIINNPEYDKSIFLAKIPPELASPAAKLASVDSIAKPDSAGHNMAE
jgi:hypothetical protein